MRKPFSIEAAKNGAKVVTRDGRAVEILKYDYVDQGEQRIVFCYTDDDGNNHACLANIDGIWEDGRSLKEDIFIDEEPTYRPYANAAEMDAAVKEHGSIVKNLYGRRLTITGYDDENILVGIGQTARYGTMLECYKWIDGTPCGVQEGDKK